MISQDRDRPRPPTLRLNERTRSTAGAGAGGPGQQRTVVYEILIEMTWRRTRRGGRGGNGDLYMAKDDLSCCCCCRCTHLVPTSQGREATPQKGTRNSCGDGRLLRHSAKPIPWNSQDKYTRKTSALSLIMQIVLRCCINVPLNLNNQFNVTIGSIGRRSVRVGISFRPVCQSGPRAWPPSFPPGVSPSPPLPLELRTKKRAFNEKRTHFKP